MAEAKTIDSLLVQLHSEAEGLDQDIASVTNLVRQADDRLRETAPNIVVWLGEDIEPTVDVEEYDEEDRLICTSHRAYRIGWARVKDPDEWGLAARVVKVRGGHDVALRWQKIDETQSPDHFPRMHVALQNAPVAVRIAALEKLPALIERLTREAKRRKEAIARAKHALS
jgi:hypothetical protein